VKYGFFGKNIGNCSTYVGEDSSVAIKNLDAVMNLFGVEKLITPKQVHGNVCAAIDSTSVINADVEADALVTVATGVAIGVLTADCVPILFWNSVQKKHNGKTIADGQNAAELGDYWKAGADRQISAIAAAHCGWRGAASGIIESTVNKILKITNCNVADIYAVTGPAIVVENYEITDDFKQNFADADDCFITNNGKSYFNLPKFCRNRLLGIDVPPKNIQCVNIDTYAHHDDYFSHRFIQKTSSSEEGRNISAICLVNDVSR
jgi:copper oxidase (laccase) domain-containing protein